jgi:hypothetical protein
MNKNAWATCLAALLAAQLGAIGCSPDREEPEELSGMLDGEHPYPNIRGGEVKGDKNFATLINKYAQGRGDRGWAGFFWPYVNNGIASGAFGGGSSHGGGGHSPAGKYDAARGGKTKAQSWEVKNHGSSVPKVQGWWGHCNGWCAASALIDEPREGAKVNGIQFTVGDLKGILSEVGMSVTADFFGNRVDPWAYDDKRWDDTVPSQFFLVLTNYMGKAGRTVLIDRFTGHEVWNQPLAGYRFAYPKPSDYLGCTNGVCKINLEVRLWWYNDSGVPAGVLTPEFNWEDARDPASGAMAIEHRDLVMELWLDGPVVFGPDSKITSSGDVLVTHDGEFYAGGAWKMGYHNPDGNPDYMWVPYSFVAPDPNDDYGNPEVDWEWVKAHLMVPGGKDDPSVRPVPVEPAPSPRPSPSPRPTTTPGPRPSSNPVPIPFPTGSPRPMPLDMAADGEWVEAEVE